MDPTVKRAPVEERLEAAARALVVQVVWPTLPRHRLRREDGERIARDVVVTALEVLLDAPAHASHSSGNAGEQRFDIVTGGRPLLAARSRTTRCR